MYTHVYIHIYVHKLAVSSPSCQHLRSLSRGATSRLRYIRAWRSLNLKSPSSSHVSTSVASDKLVQCKSTVTYIHTDICVHKIFICIDVYISIRNCFFIFPHLPASTHSGLRILERHFPWTPIRSSLELTNVEFVSSSEASTSTASDKPFAWYIFIDILIHVCIYVHTRIYIYICVHKLAVSSPSGQHLRSLSRGATSRLWYIRAWRSWISNRLLPPM